MNPMHAAQVPTPPSAQDLRPEKQKVRCEIPEPGSAAPAPQETSTPPAESGRAHRARIARGVGRPGRTGPFAAAAVLLDASADTSAGARRRFRDRTTMSKQAVDPRE